MEYGSVQNEVLSRARGSEDIRVGTPCTAIYWTDRRAYFVCEVHSKCRVCVQRASVHMKDGTTYYDQEYDRIEPDPNGEKMELIRTKKGWKELKGHTKFLMGSVYEYEDPCF